MFCFKCWHSGGWAMQESKHEQEIWRFAVLPQKTCPEPHPRGKTREVSKFGSFALNISRKVHTLKLTLKCKWHFLGPSDNSNLESCRLTDHWLGDFAPTYSWMTDQITNLCRKIIMQASTWHFLHPHLLSQQWLCDTVVSVSSLALSPGCIQIPLGGNGWHLLCLKRWFWRMGCLGGLGWDEVTVVGSQSCF